MVVNMKLKYLTFCKDCKVTEENHTHMKKIIKTICLPCGQKNDKKNKMVMGCWIDTCEMCGKENVPCADAAHDFGIYSTEEIAARDKVDDLL